ncbi:hypothetical protein HPB48_015580 [Haemaphysalis longicornis]|uniref:Transposable element P transposase-like GTP-binding insertion domain-containing protein n=3 Tax=Haemaphysalis longicornis TaxID=44386 RepID=A0A9J6FHH0_HAELO|nr:hypothetical protein HPB48_015580 [Haemaphysalis longicornis]
MNAAFYIFFSDFPHLMKNVRNGFLETGYDTPKGNVHAGFIKEAWENDRSSVTLKVMPHISRLHLYPNGFEKMRVGPALRLFSEEVLKGLYFYRSQVEKVYGPARETEAFILRMSKLIAIMTSRCAKTSLRPDSANAAYLKEFLIFLNEWELVHIRD